MWRTFFRRDFIINATYPICKDCLFFQPHNGSAPTDLAKCTKYGKKDVVTGKLTHGFASIIRSEEDKCGIKGIDFRPFVGRDKK